MMRCHVPPRTAHKVVTRLLRDGVAWASLPQVEDLDALLGELASYGVEARLHEPRPVDARIVREKTGLSEEDFALRYGLDVEHVRNWEDGTIEPDAAARTVLWTIALHPEAIEATLQANSEEAARLAFGA